MACKEMMLASAWHEAKHVACGGRVAANGALVETDRVRLFQQPFPTCCVMALVHAQVCCSSVRKGQNAQPCAPPPSSSAADSAAAGMWEALDTVAPIKPPAEITISFTNAAVAMPVGCAARAVPALSAGPARRPAAPVAAALTRIASYQRCGGRQCERQQDSPTATAPRRQRRARSRLIAAQASSNGGSSAAGDEVVDVVVIGSGIGGLSCAGWLAKYGLKVRCNTHAAKCHEMSNNTAPHMDEVAHLLVVQRVQVQQFLERMLPTHGAHCCHCGIPSAGGGV